MTQQTQNKVAAKRRIGKTALEVTALSLGSAPLGGMYRDLPDAEAVATIEAAWQSGIRFFDTAPHYGHTKAEHRMGDALRRLVKAGIRLQGASDHGVSEALYLADPDQNGVELYRDRPREEWPLDAKGNLAMTTAPLDLQNLLREALLVADHAAYHLGELIVLRRLLGAWPK